MTKTKNHYGDPRCPDCRAQTYLASQRRRNPCPWAPPSVRGAHGRHGRRRDSARPAAHRGRRCRRPHTQTAHYRCLRGLCLHPRCHKQSRVAKVRVARERRCRQHQTHLCVPVPPDAPPSAPAAGSGRLGGRVGTNLGFVAALAAAAASAAAAAAPPSIFIFGPKLDIAMLLLTPSLLQPLDPQSAQRPCLRCSQASTEHREPRPTKQLVVACGFRFFFFLLNPSLTRSAPNNFVYSYFKRSTSTSEVVYCCEVFYLSFLVWTVIQIVEDTKGRKTKATGRFVAKSLFSMLNTTPAPPRRNAGTFG